MEQNTNICNLLYELYMPFILVELYSDTMRSKSTSFSVLL